MAQWFSVSPYIALINLYAGEKVVPEFLFARGEEEPIHAAADSLFAGPARESVCERLSKLRQERFLPGAAARAADHIVEFLDQTI